MSTHARLSPSAAFRWMSCTAAPALEATMPDQTSAFAAEGTRAHALAEFYARRACGLDPGQKPKADDVEMIEAAGDYAQHVKETYLKAKETCADAVLETEQRLDLSRWIPEGFGTADCLIVTDGRLHVIDFKYGKGVPVSAEENKQMMIYALGALDWAELLFDIEEIELTIIQPRLNSHSSWTIRADALVDWGEQILAPIAQIAYAGDGTRYEPTEDNCRFCKAAGSCQARADYFVSLFDDNEEPGLLTSKEAGEILTRAAGMKAWLQALEETVKAACLAGKELPGWKIVEGRTKRRYTDEDEIAKRLRAKKFKVGDLYEKKLLGISKMEKLVGKKRLAEICGDLIEKPQGAPTLVPESDDRPRWDPEEKTIAAFDEE